MIRHICVFRAFEDAPVDEVETMLVELGELVMRMPGAVSWEVGVNLGLRDTTFSHGFASEFDTEESLSAYLADPDHIEFVVSRWRPLIEDRAIVSFVV